MPAISFSSWDFIEKIKAGVKDQTIRPLGKRRYKKGQGLHIYYKQRTPQRQFIDYAEVTRVIILQWKDILEMEEGKRERFARRDGFSSWAELITWFVKQHDPKPEDYFQVVRFAL